MRLTTKVAAKYLPSDSSGTISQIAERANSKAAEQLSLSVGKFNSEYLQQLSTSIGAYLKRANSAVNRFEAQWRKVRDTPITAFTEREQQSYNLKDDEKEKQEYLHSLRKYLAAKQAIGKNTANILKEGYVLIDYIREAVTGQQTVYRVGFQEEGELYTGTLTLEQILKISRVDIQWKGFGASAFKLRLHADVHTKSLKGSLSKNFSGQYLQYIHSIIRQSSTKVNKGNLFEAFIELSNSGCPESVSVIRNVFEDVKQNTVSFVKGGDIDNESVKFFGSDPSLASLSTIIKALTQLQMLINTAKNPDQLKIGLQVLFTKEGAEKFKSGKFKNILDKEMKKLCAELAKT